jgi:hypothetical protein
MMNTTSFSIHEQLLDIPLVSTSPDLTPQPDLVFTSSPLLFISSGGSLVQPRPREDIRGVFVSCTCMKGGGILSCTAVPGPMLIGGSGLLLKSGSAPKIPDRRNHEPLSNDHELLTARDGCCSLSHN